MKSKLIPFVFALLGCMAVAATVDILTQPADNSPTGTDLLNIYKVSGSTSTVNKITLTQLSAAIFNPASPGAIGGTTPAAGAFTTLTLTPLATGQVNGATLLAPNAGNVGILVGHDLSRQIGIAWDNDGSIGQIQTASYGAPIFFGGTDFRFAPGGTEVIRITSGGIVLMNATVPANSSDTGTAHTITWDANYIYVCTATNTWKRAALTTW